MHYGLKGKILVPPIVPMVPKTSIGAFSGASYREHVKCTEAKSSAPDVPVTIGALDRINDVSYAGKMSQNSLAPEAPMHHRSNDDISLLLC